MRQPLSLRSDRASFTAMRRGATLRLSPGIVTSGDDVDALCAALDELLLR
jgi:selenocysteine lyase/cysteine desulfurase